jgi:hypothetical protein
VNKIYKFFEKLYNNITIEYLKYAEMFNRMIFWAWKMRWSWDFDIHTVYEMLYLKLDRSYNCFLKNGHLVWNSNPNNKLMRRLQEARYLAKRLCDDEYKMRAFYETNEKFVHYFKTFKIKNKSLYESISNWKNKPRLAELFYNGKTKIYQNMENYERKRLFHLLEKYINKWWD